MTIQQWDITTDGNASGHIIPGSPSAPWRLAAHEVHFSGGKVKIVLCGFTDSTMAVECVLPRDQRQVEANHDNLTPKTAARNFVELMLTEKYGSNWSRVD